MFKRALFLSLFVSFALYSAYVWTAGTALPDIRPPSDLARRGQTLFQTSNCTSCHQLYGLGGHLGPDLTNVASSPDKGIEYIKLYLAYGSEKMPNFGFSEADQDALAAFLVFVDQTGTYPPLRPDIKWYGSVGYESDKDAE